MSKRTKHSIAIWISKGKHVLATRRPDDDDELPGIWGLPAGTCRDGETVEEVIIRVGREKLGVTLAPQKQLASGTQDRPRYLLYMELWQASMTGTPTCPQWQWADVELFREGAAAGSLCCELAIKTRGRVSS
jgi:ADP-ribose pyrophosphatase YjhB (NUDIX family)